MSRLANHRPKKSDARNTRAKTRPLAIHEANEAGAKLERRYAKAILRRQKEPATSSNLSFDRARVVRKRYDNKLRGRN